MPDRRPPYNPSDQTQLYSPLSQQLQVRISQIEQAVRLLEDDRTIPFIARYRKEATGGLDEIQLRHIEDALIACRELETRRTAILRALKSVPVPESVIRAIEHAADRAELERIYQPWKSRRKTRADTARERGLGRLAQILKQQNACGTAEQIAGGFVRAERNVPDIAAAVDGACDIVVEEWAADDRVVDWMLERTPRARLASRAKRGKADQSSPYRDYFSHEESVERAMAHRLLAMFRGAAEGVLHVSVQLDDQWVVERLERRWIRNPRFVFAERLSRAVRDCYKRLLHPAMQSTVLTRLKERAERKSIDVFAANLRSLLMAAPAGTLPTIGIDPGFRTGCKVAVVDATGTLLEHTTIYPTAPKCDLAGASARLKESIDRHHVKLIAIGNGTASRETHSFVSDLIEDCESDITVAVVSEAGASIYSASKAAAEEYPDLDLAIRSAISIAHRLQDPLSELVKMDPATIGVGQYQHDVNQTELKRVLQREVESCVAQVGVNLNTASTALLSAVAGIGPDLASRIVKHRNEHGRFHNRQELHDVSRLGRVTFEQASGFLRVPDGDNPLDRTAVHPESYGIVESIAARLDCSVELLIADPQRVESIAPADFVSGETGVTTVEDILEELKRPARDPRQDFQSVAFDDKVRQISDLREGMQLEGIVTNVTAFGAFVDIGVHQDGLLHVSEMAECFVSEPSREVSVGQVIQVRVVSFDPIRKRISLSRKSTSGKSETR